MSFHPLHSLVVEKAGSLGFLAVGFTGPGRPLHFDRFTSWLAGNKNGDMAWLERNLEVRENPSRMLRNCRTVISLAYPYPSRRPETVDGFSVARFADPLREDYHSRLRMLCNLLVSFLKDYDPGCRSRVCVDSPPIMERSMAEAAGIGFIGKNNLLIVPGYGSCVYLAEILTTAAIASPPHEPVINRCGACCLCLEACPTGALEQPFVLNASKCLSYLTIEDKGLLKADLGPKMGTCFFGCDRCQEACPLNREMNASDVVLPSTGAFLAMGEKAFARDFGKTALARTGIEKLKGNIYAVRKGR